MSEHVLLISGSSGTLGRALIASLKKDKYDLFVVKADSKLQSVAGDYIKDQVILNYSTVNFVHLASPNAADCHTNPIAALDVNYNLVRNIFKKSYAQKISNIIFTSTARIYGDNITTSVDETSRVNIENEYAAVKYLTEGMLRQSWQNKKIKPNIYVLRVSNVASVLCHEKTNRPLLNEFCWNAAKYNQITINNKKNFVKNFVNIQNVCDSIIELLKRKKTPEFIILNVTGDQCFSLYDIAFKIKQYFGSKYGKEIIIKHHFNTLEKTKNDLIVSYSRVSSLISYSCLSIDPVVHAQVDEYYEFFKV